MQDAQFQEAVLNYQNTVLKAQQEVEDGLSAFYTSQEALTSLDAAATAAVRSTQLSLLQYKAGETTYTTVITSEQSQLSIEDAVASTRGNVALGRIAVYRALGGGWELRGDRDVVSDAVKEEMDRRTNWGDLARGGQAPAERVAGGGAMRMSGRRAAGPTGSCGGRRRRARSRSRSRSRAATGARRRSPSTRR